MTTRPSPAPVHAIASRALKSLRGSFVAVFLTSAMINVLALCGSLFTIQVYDRVLPGHSLPTLVSLLAIMLVVYAVQATLDSLRSRILSRIGQRVDAQIMPLALTRVRQQAMLRSASGDGMQAVRDADQLRSFLAGNGPVTLIDLPWLPLFVIATFVLHPWIGLMTVAGAVVLMLVLLITETASKSLSGKTAEQMSRRNAFAEAMRRDPEAASSMGLAARLHERFLARHGELSSTQLRLSDVSASYAPLARAFRQLLQMGIVAVGAYVVIEGQASAGIMFAASILTGRALSPIDAAIASWRQMQATRQSLARLDQTLTPAEAAPTPLPAPCEVVTVQKAAIAAPGGETAILAGLDFKLAAGEVMVVLGASGSGKSTLGRALLGLWPKLSGEIRLDGAALTQWTAEALGQFTGYLPQSVELIEGTIGENIARFARAAAAQDIVEAAKTAGVHEFILSLPKGYDTVVGANGLQLSGGQRQRIGLARALYGRPFLVVLDEPNSALDAMGEAALNRAIGLAKARGAIVIVIAHRPSVLAHADKALLVDKGRQAMFGPRDAVLGHLSAQSAQRRPGQLQAVS